MKKNSYALAIVAALPMSLAFSTGCQWQKAFSFIGKKRTEDPSCLLAAQPISAASHSDNELVSNQRDSTTSAEMPLAETTSAGTTGTGTKGVQAGGLPSLPVSYPLQGAQAGGLPPDASMPSAQMSAPSLQLDANKVSAGPMQESFADIFSQSQQFAGYNTPPQSNASSDTRLPPEAAAPTYRVPNQPTLGTGAESTAAASSLANGPVSTASLKTRLRIANVRPGAGVVRIATFVSAATFPDRNQATRKLEVQPQSNVVVADIPANAGLPTAYAAFQDLNGDGQLNRTALGIPSEPYGFSNAARGSMGAPAFAAAAVPGNAPEVQITLQ